MRSLTRAAAGLAVLLTCFVPAETDAENFLLTPGFEGQDTTYYSFIPLLIRGQYNTLYAQTAGDENGFDHSMRTFLRFDLPEDMLEEGETVTEAYLLMVYSFSFDHTGEPPDVPSDLTVHRVLEDWEEDSLNFENAPPIGPGIETETNIVEFRVIELDVTELVRDWAEGTLPNYGFALTNTSERPVGFYSWESSVDEGLKNSLFIVTGPANGNGGNETRLEISAPEPDFDRWMYPFNASPGMRNLASTFLASGESEFDDRDGILALAFDTEAAGVPSGLGAERYVVESLTVTATHFQGDLLYDGTPDPWQTVLDPEDPDYVEDADAGRPLEIHGLGLRNGYAFVELGMGAAGPPGFEEDEAFGESVDLLPGTRNVYPLGFGVPDPEGDVSNNVALGFDAAPWAVGKTTSGLLPGDPVPEGVPGVSAGETFAFQVDVSDPDVQAYLREGLDAGVLGFVVSSLHSTVEQAGGTNPNFYTRDSFDPAAIPPTLELEVTLVPEPALGAQIPAALAALAWLGRRRRRNRRRSG